MAPSKIGGPGGSGPRSVFHSPAYMPLKMTDSMRYSDNQSPSFAPFIPVLKS